MDEVRIFTGMGGQKSNRIATNRAILADETSFSTLPLTSTSADDSSHS